MSDTKTSSGYPYWDKIDEPGEWIDRMIDEESASPIGIGGTWQLMRATNGNTLLRLKIGDQTIQVQCPPFGTDAMACLCRRILRAAKKETTA